MPLADESVQVKRLRTKITSKLDEQLIKMEVNADPKNNFHVSNNSQAVVE